MKNYTLKKQDFIQEQYNTGISEGSLHNMFSEDLVENIKKYVLKKYEKTSASDEEISKNCFALNIAFGGLIPCYYRE